VSFPLADFGSRLAAYLVDYALYLLVSTVVAAPFLVWYFVSLFDFISAAEHQQEVAPGDFFLLLLLPMMFYVLAAFLVAIGYTYAYFVEYQLRNGGQTLGKRLLTLRVIPVEPGAELTRMHLVKRWAVQWAAGSVVPLLHYLHGFWQLWDKPLQQCLHDKAANTVVVRLG
jgi:uncharacterized RDD family membrane protein YckC